MWRQRSRITWLMERDKNTAFFHNTTTTRKKCNTIEGIMDEKGVLVKEEVQIQRVAKKYFGEIFKGAVDRGNAQEVLAVVDRRVTEDMNVRLLLPFSKEEIHQALKQMAPLKAPGIDGLHALFYQRYWSSLGNDLTDVVLEFLNGGRMNAEWNSTRIILIPKVKKPKVITDFRPISLSNVTYKIKGAVALKMDMLSYPKLVRARFKYH